MKKYWDVDRQKIWTEDEVRENYEYLKRIGDLDAPEIYNSFDYYLNSCLVENNGSLLLIASDEDIENKRRWTAIC